MAYTAIRPSEKSLLTHLCLQPWPCVRPTIIAHHTRNCTYCKGRNEVSVFKMGDKWYRMYPGLQLCLEDFERQKSTENQGNIRVSDCPKLNSLGGLNVRTTERCKAWTAPSPVCWRGTDTLGSCSAAESRMPHHAKRHRHRASTG